jgi:hypothetical protein
MEVDRLKIIQEIKVGKNPNPFKNKGGEEGPKKTETVVELALSPTLVIERIFDCDTEEDTLMEELGEMRVNSLVKWFLEIRESFIKKMYEWFEM